LAAGWRVGASGAAAGFVSGGISTGRLKGAMRGVVSVITLLEEASSQESPAYEENAPPKNPSLKFPPAGIILEN
jgi:hypothetical protein